MEEYNATPEEMELGYGYRELPKEGNKTRTSRSGNDYKQMSEEIRAYYKDVHSGSKARFNKQDYVFDIEKNKYSMATLNIPDALCRMFLEISTNAGDNAEDSRKYGIDPNCIKYWMTEDTIKIRSYGEPIPVVVKDKISTPSNIVTTVDFIFGVVGTGSNYDTTIANTLSGVNGIGAKLVNIGSRKFKVTVGDAKNGIYHQSIWSHNMRNKVSSISNPPFAYINGQWVSNGPRYTGESFVEVEYMLDFRPYACTSYSNLDYLYFMRHAIDISFTCKVPIYFNDKLYDYRKIEKYSTLFFPKDLGYNSMVHYEWPDNQVLPKNKIDDLVANATLRPILEVCILDTPNQGTVISYVNGMITPNGGSHVNSIREIFSELIKEYFNKDKEDGHKITLTDIKKHLTFMVSCRIANPKWGGGNSKNELKGPKINSTFKEEDLKKIKNWEVIKAMKNIFDEKAKIDAKKTDGKKKKFVSMKDGENANWAGTRNSLDAVFLISEGNSADAYAKEFILGTKERKNKYGRVAIQGKFKNIADETLCQMNKNKEIESLKKILGLSEESNYNIIENTSFINKDGKKETIYGAGSLRYGTIMACTDSDDDGSHILALLVNFFHRRFPTILTSGRFKFLLTPVIRVLKFKGSKETVIAKFFNNFDFEKWRKENKTIKNYDVKYYKGLATARPSDIKDDIISAPRILFLTDKDYANSLDVAFKKKNSNIRKKWIDFYRDKIGKTEIYLNSPDPIIKAVNITDYLNIKLVEYSLSTFSRSLPKYHDGLKLSQRQLLYYVLVKWDYGRKEKGSIKAGRIASNAAGECNYHHADSSLENVLVKMAQDYPGSNNLNYFKQEGQFGSRDGNKDGIGKDCGAGRYIETLSEWWIKYVFTKELVEFVPKVIVEDKEAEPKNLICTIPLEVVNGSLGLATAHSNNIFPHHPVDVIDLELNYIDCRMNNKPIIFKKIVPWFKGFTGAVNIVKTKVRAKKSKDENEEDEQVEEPIEDNGDVTDEKEIEDDNDSIWEGKLSLKTYGIYQITNRRYSNIFNEHVHDIHITEIPIGVAIYKYRKWLEKLQEEGHIEDFNDNMKDKNHPDISIIGWRGLVNERTLKLYKTSGLSNITLIDHNSFPIPMYHVEETIKYFCDNMYDFYEEFQKSKVDKIKEEIAFQEKFIKLIELITTGVIVTNNVKTSFIESELVKHNIPKKCYEKITEPSKSLEGKQRNKNKLDKLIDELNIILSCHPTKMWKDSLINFKNILNSRPEFTKLNIHKYPDIFINIGKYTKPTEAPEPLEVI